MGELILQNSTAQPLRFVLVQSADHISSLTGKAGSVTVKISKNGAAPVTPSGAISELDSTNAPGEYVIAGNATDTNTLGSIDIYAKDAASDPVNMINAAQVVAFDPRDATRLGLAALPNVAAGLANGLVLLATNNPPIGFAGTAAAGATPAVPAVTLVGGAASTTALGVSSAALLLTGGAGASSTNGAAPAIVGAGGGTTTVSGAQGFTFTGTGNKAGGTITGAGTGDGLDLLSGTGATGDGLSAKSQATNGSGITMAHAGTGFDLNATTTPLLLAKSTNITGFNDLAGAAIATAVWQDSTAGDFTTASSIGKGLYPGNNAPGSASGLALVSSIPTTAQIATGVWQDSTAGDFTVASSAGKSIFAGNNAPGTTGGLATSPVTVGTNNDKTGYQLSATGNNNIWDVAVSLLTDNLSVGYLVAQALGGIFNAGTALTAVPASTANLITQVMWLFMNARNKQTQTSSTLTLFADDSSTSVSTAAVSDDGTTFTKAKNA